MPLNPQWSVQLKNKIRKFNLFESRKRSERDLENQRLSTRIYCVLLFFTTVALLLYASLANVTKTVIVEQPSLSVYETLRQTYPATLVCPCQQTLIAYEAFIVSFKPRFNQICSSDFITTDWLNYVNYRSSPVGAYHLHYDFRHSAYSFFNMLNLMCQLAAATVDDQLIKFYSSSLVTENVISRTEWAAIVGASKDQFVSTITDSFLTALNSFTAVIQGNNIDNQLGTNWLMTHITINGLYTDVGFFRFYPPDDLNSCSCSSSSHCKMTTGIYKVYRKNLTSIPAVWIQIATLLKGQLEFEVEGINVGCYTLNAVLQSNLSCLYNISCLTHLYTYLHDSPYPINTSNIKALNVSSSSSPTSLPTVQTLVENLLVDEWHFKSSFDSYFAECNAQSCSYTYAHQFDVIFIVTTTVAFLGGIVTILRATVLPVTAFLREKVTAMRSKCATSAATTRNVSGK